MRLSPRRESSVLKRAVVVGLVTAVMIPIVALLLHSVGDRWFYPDLLPERVSMRAWNYVFSPTSGVIGATATSLGIALTVTAACILVGVPAGRGLAALHTKARRVWEALFLLPIVVPSLAAALGLHVAFIRLGLADTIAGVAISHLLPTIPYMVLVMAGSFANVDVDLEAQARTLGAGPVRAFLTVGVRAALPGMVTGSLFVFLISWSQYALTLLIGGGRVMTLPLLMFAFASAGDLSVTAALSVVFLLPAVVILAVTARFVTSSGTSLGGMAAG
jgi:putative spermidine/putrescine transport system permease protein